MNLRDCSVGVVNVDGPNAVFVLLGWNLRFGDRRATWLGKVNSGFGLRVVRVGGGGSPGLDIAGRVHHGIRHRRVAISVRGEVVHVHVLSIVPKGALEGRAVQRRRLHRNDGRSRQVNVSGIVNPEIRAASLGAEDDLNGAVRRVGDASVGIREHAAVSGGKRRRGLRTSR